MPVPLRSTVWLLLGALILTAGCGGSSTPIPEAHGSTNPPADTAQPIDDQIAACNKSAACSINLGPGEYSFATPVAPKAMFSIHGAGASFDNPGIPTTAQFPQVETHCLTRLTWTGGTSVPFQISSYHLQGSKLSGFCLDATGAAPPSFIDVDDFAGGVVLEDIVIDAPQTQATVAAIRYGPTSLVVDQTCTNVFVRGAAPIGFAVLNLQAHFAGNHCRAVWNGTNEWVFGDRSHAVESFHCVFCTAEARPGNVPVLIVNTIGFWWSEGYLECGGSAAAYCFDIPSTAIQARNVVISNNFVGGNSSLPGTTGFVHSGLSAATLTVSGNLVDYVFANPAFLVQNEAGTRITVTGNTMSSPGSSVSSSPLNVCALGNSTSVHASPAGC